VEKKIKLAYNPPYTNKSVTELQNFGMKNGRKEWCESCTLETQRRFEQKEKTSWKWKPSIFKFFII